MANNIVQINSNNGINVTTQTSNDIISVVALGPQGPQGPQGEPGDGFPFNGGIAQITGSLQVTGSTILTGSLNVSEGITGSLQGTASWAQNSITASYALNASGVDTSSLVTTSSFNSFTSSIQSFTQSIQSSVNSLTNATSSYLLRSETSSLTQLSTFNNFTSSYTTGSFTGSFTGSLLGTASKVIIGDLGSNVYPIAIASPSGDILKADGFILNGSTKFLNLPNDYYLYMPGTSTVNAGTFSGNLSGNVTGNLTGTASFATSASRALNSNSASFATSASYAQTASYTPNAITNASNEFAELTFTKGDGTEIVLTADPRRVVETVKNADSTTLPKGTPVYVSGSTGNASNVYRADAGDAAKMPAAYVLDEELIAGQEGTALLTGFINNVNTSTFQAGQAVYVAVGGGYTNVKPTGSALIQKLGNVIKVDVNGSGVITGAGRSNDIPNITSGYVWVGNNDQVPTPISTSSLSVNSASYALNADNIDLDSVGDDNTYGFVFKDGTSFGYNKLYADSQEDTPSWNPSTNTFKAANIVSTVQFSGSFSIPASSTSVSRFNIPLLSAGNSSFQRSGQSNLTFTPGDTNPSEGILYLTGSLNILSGSITITSGSLIGTSSFATTASYVLNAISASYIQNAQSASYVLNAISSSFTTTASYALNGGVTFPYTGSALITGSLIVTGSVTSTEGFTGSLLGTASRAVSSSYALTASYALSSAGGSGGTSLGSIFITLYDGGANLTTGKKDTPVYVPYNGTFTGWEMLAYNSSNNLMTASCVVDVISGKFNNLPISTASSIAGTQKPTLTNQSSSFSSSLSTWTSLIAGDYIQAEIESVSTGVAKITVAIKVTKS